MQTKAAETSPTPDMIDQAARWAATLDAGDMSADDQRAYAAWCAAHPLHQRMLDRMRAFDARVANAADFERDALRTVLERRRYRRLGGPLLGMLLLGVAGWAGIQSDYVRNRFPDYQTEKGQLRTVALKDRSEITLDTDGAVGVDMDDTHRQVRLIRGQLLVKVAEDQTRPFIVETEHGTATALGTSFIVRREDSYTMMTVIESRIRVCPAEKTDEDGCRTLAAGERARVTRSAVLAEPPADPAAAAMWSSGWLEADDQEVGTVLAELTRYSKRPIRFDAATLRGVKVTGSYPLRDIDRAIDGIGRTATLRVHRSANGEIVITRQR